MAKILPVFQQLAPIDKEPFITNVLVVISLLTQSYYSHENCCEIITYPDGFTPLWLVQKQQKEITKLETEVFIRCIQPVKRIDLTKEEYVLIKAIIFCNPACSNISDAGQQLLEQECERYSKTLLRYMQSIHGGTKGASRYAQVIAVMEAMAYFAERLREFHLIRMIQRAQEAKRQGQKSRAVYVIDDLF
uniref:NR LBD domain-containing protein n=1 Tax=Panagrellus redivivus TaxID=6233 RepID=A0A7E4ZYA2_PANRE